MAPHVTTIILLYDFTTLLALILKHILIHQLIDKRTTLCIFFLKVWNAVFVFIVHLGIVPFRN